MNTDASKASDDEYSAFLTKASKYDNSLFNTIGEDAQSEPSAMHPDLPEIASTVSSQTFTSETDESFVPVFFADAEVTELPTAAEFDQYISVEGRCSLLTAEQWDPHGSYGVVLDAVRKFVRPSSRVAVYQVHAKGARVVYFILGLSSRKDGLIGVKTRAVES